MNVCILFLSRVFIMKKKNVMVGGVDYGNRREPGFVSLRRLV